MHWVTRNISRLLVVILVALSSQALLMAQSASPHLVVNTFRLNVRSGPGPENSVLTTVPGGTELPVLMIGADGKWYQVTSPVGAGWVHSAYTVGRGDFSSVPRAGTPTDLATGTGEIASGAPHVVVNTSYLNVRRGPGIGHDVLTVVPGGTTLSVTAIDSTRKWYQVATSAGSGWLHSAYTVDRGDFSGVPIEGAPTPTGTVSTPVISGDTPHLVVNTAFLNVRTGPGASHDILTTVPGGTKLPVVLIAPDRKWFQVESSAGTGWVHTAYTVGRGDFSGVPVAVDPLTGTTPRAVVNTSRLNIRSGPGVGHDILTSVPGGTTLAVLGLSSDRDWYLVEGDFGQGWLNNFYTVFRGDFSQVQVVS